MPVPLLQRHRRVRPRRARGRLPAPFRRVHEMCGRGAGAAAGEARRAICRGDDLGSFISRSEILYSILIVVTDRSRRAVDDSQYILRNSLCSREQIL